MNEEPYKNREIDEKFVDIRETLGRIEIQTKMTNGRVTALEKWRYVIMGAVAVLVSIVVPILAWALWVLVNIQGQVHQAVDDALSAYNIIK